MNRSTSIWSARLPKRSLLCIDLLNVYFLHIETFCCIVNYITYKVHTTGNSLSFYFLKYSSYQRMLQMKVEYFNQASVLLCVPFLYDKTENNFRVVSTPASYPEGPGFKSQLGDPLS
jgi:hypothetical protein